MALHKFVRVYRSGRRGEEKSSSSLDNLKKQVSWDFVDYYVNGNIQKKEVRPESLRE